VTNDNALCCMKSYVVLNQVVNIVVKQRATVIFKSFVVSS
jgi:hypothetical protein